jgi:hypothetical protein
MTWIEITLESILAHMPSDLSPAYEEWVTTFPDKAGRLEAVMDNTLREFRDAIKSVPENQYDQRPNVLPQSSLRHVESIVYFQIELEMGRDISSERYNTKIAADIFLRQIPFGRYRTTVDDPQLGAPLPSPHYVIPERIEYRSDALGVP